MPSKSPEPSSYSLDEMMDRLREGDRGKREDEESGELVTRPDGSQVMRVKRRKRRSEQSVKKQAKKKTSSKSIRLIAGGTVIVLLFLLLIGGLLQLAKFNSEGFHEKLEDNVSAATGGDVSITRLAVTPEKARAEKVQAVWPESSLLRFANFRDVEAGVGLSGFFSSRWGGDQIVAKSGVVRLSGGSATSYPTFSDSIPFQYDELLCKKMDIYFGAEENPPLSLKGVELSVRGEAGNRQGVLYGGSMELRGWGRMNVGNGVLRFEEDGFVLSTLRLSSEEGRGDIILKSEQVVLPGKDTTLDVTLANISLGHLLGKDLGGILNGTVNSQAGKVSVSTAGFAESVLSLPVEGSGGELRGLPFLISLRTILSDTEFAKPFFRDVSANIYRKGDEVMIKDLVLSEKGFMEVRGNMSVGNEGQLSGMLRVGVHENKAISSTGRKRSEVFSDPVGGYVWVEIELGGTVDIPEDNWSALLRKAAQEAAEQRKSNNQP